MECGDLAPAGAAPPRVHEKVIFFLFLFRVSRPAIWLMLKLSKSVARRHQTMPHTVRWTKPKKINFPIATEERMCGPRPDHRGRAVGASERLALLRPSVEAPHGRRTTTKRRGFVPVGALGVGSCGSRSEPSLGARAPGEAGLKFERP